MISEVCEAFHCLPSEAMLELQRDPYRLALKIVSLRSFVQAHAAMASATKRGAKLKDQPYGPVVDLVNAAAARVIKEIQESG